MRGSIGDVRVVAAQADALFSTFVTSAITGLAGAILIASTMTGTSADSGAHLFVYATAAILVVRLAARYLYGQHGSAHPLAWLRGGAALIAVSGLVWGAMMFWSTRAANDTQLLVATAVTLGAVMITITSASYWPAHLAFHVPASMLTAVGFFTSGRPGHIQIGIATIILCVGMMVSGRRIGGMIVHSMRLAAENATLVDQLHDQTRQLSDANDELAQLSNTDALTTLANRRGFSAALEQQWSRAIARNQSIALLAIDVDHFKAYNDRYGHAAGDLCLQVVADVLSSSARGTSDVSARIGGEEFAVLLPGASPDAAMLVAERIRATIESFSMEPAADLPAATTVSIGVHALMPEPGTDASRLLDHADRALYHAKNAGRNRVSLWQIDDDQVTA